MAKITFLGHACFLIESDRHKVIIDPFLTDNPQAAMKADEVEVDAIILTHGHNDHIGDTLSIAKRANALIIANFEIASYFGDKGATAHPLHIGGSRKFDFGRVKLTPAFHGSSFTDENGQKHYMGMPAGVLLTMDDKIIYHLGDTGLFSDMKLIGDLNDIEVALIPIGGNFTMDVDDAVNAVEFIHPRSAVPMHFNTWEVINTDPQEFANKLKDSPTNTVVLQPGEFFSV